MRWTSVVITVLYVGPLNSIPVGSSLVPAISVTRPCNVIFFDRYLIYVCMRRA